MIRPQWRRERDTVLTITVAVVACVALLVAALAVLVRQVSVSWQPVIVLAALAHQLLWAAPVAVILLAIVRRWRLLAAATLVLVLAIIGQAPLYRSSGHPAVGTPLNVLQANLRIGSAEPASLVRMVQDRHVDVLMSEELTPEERDRLVSAGLAALLPYRFDAALAGGGGGLAIWSRYPLSAEQNFAGFELGVLQARIQLSPTETATVLAVHLLPPYPYPPREWLAELKRLRPILAAAAANPAPVIVAGDFNATTDHPQFRALLGHGYSDAAEHTGAGYLASYPADRWFPPLIAIDHVLTSGASAESARTLDLPGSDHRALLVSLRL
ncbi:MAG: hypothetical protein JWO63_2035 [Frankiales bacterium]|nr:hypothetical protein [Frankiales bacterium]